MTLRASLFLTFFAATAALLVSMPVHAAATNGFQSTEYNGGQDFAYTYQTLAGQTQTLSFRLNLSDIARGSHEFTAWDDDALQEKAQSAADAAAQKMAEKLSTPARKITIEKGLLGRIKIRLTSRGPADDGKAIMDSLQTAMDKAAQDTLKSYAASHYYRVIPKGNKNGIMPNHAAIAQRYTAAMAPVAKAIREQIPGAKDNPRAFINAALSWLQTIPYDTLQDRYSSNGAGFQTPYGLLQGNVGDCDTKATALAALIHAVYPTIPLTMVYVPDHAFLGIGLPQDSSDYALQTSGGTYILADATGPGLTPLGYIDERTRTGIRNHKSDLLPIP